MNTELLEALNILEKEKDISKETLLDAIENSLMNACKNHFGKTDNIKLIMNKETCEYQLYAEKTVVEEVEDKLEQISLEDAKEIDSKFELGDIVHIPIESKSFGRIATQNAKNLILQKIREEERKVVYDQYFEKEKDIVTGIVQRYVGKNVSREAGSRTKIAVWSNDPDVDPVGACVGMNGARVNAIVNELRGEKIDIINWSDNPAILIENALSPAKVISVMADPDEKTASVIVPDYQLSLAIGKEGQNARLAARLTGYKIDIKNETQAIESGELPENYMELSEGVYEEEYDDDAEEFDENTADAEYDEDDAEITFDEVEDTEE